MNKASVLIIILFLWVTGVNAQDVMQNNGNMQIHSGASMTGFGNFTNASTATLINNGALYVKGNLSNDQASMSAGTGTLYLNGSSAQAVNGSQAFKAYNLNTNNSAGITLNNNLSVTNAHTFSAGIITSSATPNYLIYESGSSYSGDGDATHVHGWVKKIGSSNFTFPVGTGSVERTIALKSLSSSSEFNVTHSLTTPNRYQVQSPVQYMDPHEYWTINQVSGGSATVAMNWNNAKVTFPNWVLTDILTAYFNGSNWTSTGGSASGNSLTAGTISSNSVSSFGQFSFGSLNFPLPLTLISFNAKRSGDHTEITWVTVDEQNVNYFVVERSDDGIHFYAISQVPARNRSNRETYTSNDFASINGIAYYRLRSVDIDGKEKLSSIVSVTADGQNNQLKLLSNPVQNKKVLLISHQLNGLFNYHITAMNGQLMQQGKLMLQSGGVSQLELKSYVSPGAYTLEVMNETESFRYKIIIQ
jgi:hypothetical protein